MEETSKSQKIYLFEQMAVWKAVLKLAIPTVIGSLVMILYNLADTFFVGFLNDPVQNAAVTLAAPVILAFNAVNNLFGVGGSSMMSRALGAKRYEDVYESCVFSLYGAATFAIILGGLCAIFKSPLLGLLGAAPDNIDATQNYMFWAVICGALPSILNVVMAYFIRSEGESLHASIGTMSGCILNIILDPIFILPGMLNMGAAGAGLATFLSNCAACMYFAIFLVVRKGRTFVCVNPKYLKFRKHIVKGVFSVGIPAAIQNLLNVLGMTILNNFTSKFGSDAVAAMGISYKMTMIPMYITQGVTQGIMPLVGYNYAAGNEPRCRKTVTFTSVVSLVFLVICAVLYFMFARGIVTLFIKDANVISYGTFFIRAMCLEIPFIYLDFLGVGMYQACGMGLKSLLFAVARKLVLEIPALLVLNRLFPLYGLPFAQPFAEFVLAIAAVLVIRSIFRKMRRESDKGAEAQENSF